MKKASKMKTRSSLAGFTLVEIMIVVAIIALLAAIAVPSFMRARKRAQATYILEDLRILDAAIQQYAIERNKKTGDAFGWNDLIAYVKPGSRLHTSNGLDIHGHEMATLGGATISDEAGQIRVCYVTFDSLSDVAPTDFWSPFGIEPR